MFIICAYILAAPRMEKIAFTMNHRRFGVPRAAEKRQLGPKRFKPAWNEHVGQMSLNAQSGLR